MPAFTSNGNDVNEREMLFPFFICFRSKDRKVLGVIISTVKALYSEHYQRKLSTITSLHKLNHCCIWVPNSIAISQQLCEMMNLDYKRIRCLDLILTGMAIIQSSANDKNNKDKQSTNH